LYILIETPSNKRKTSVVFSAESCVAHKVWLRVNEELKELSTTHQNWPTSLNLHSHIYSDISCCNYSRVQIQM